MGVATVAQFWPVLSDVLMKPVAVEKMVATNAPDESVATRRHAPAAAEAEVSERTLCQGTPTMIYSPSMVGSAVLGAYEGILVGSHEGTLDGAYEGNNDGTKDGNLDGSKEGALLGANDEGALLGANDEGALVGKSVGTCDNAPLRSSRKITNAFRTLAISTLSC